MLSNKPIFLLLLWSAAACCRFYIGAHCRTPEYEAVDKGKAFAYNCRVCLAVYSGLNAILSIKGEQYGGI
jgi:hypothetical protein